LWKLFEITSIVFGDERSWAEMNCKKYAKKKHKRNLNPPACSVECENSRAEQACRKEAKRDSRAADTLSWYRGM
jgi:hypothetical protein